MIGAELMSARNQFRAELGVIIDLTVERDDDAAILVAHRLRCRDGEVDDGKAAVS
jgi:hypothetical protein